MISYFTEDIKFELKGKLLNNRWLKMVVGSEVKKMGDLSIIFCSDPYILDINLRYLQHDYFTDIITFDYCEGILSPAIFLSASTAFGRTRFSMAPVSRMSWTV